MRRIGFLIYLIFFFVLGSPDGFAQDPKLIDSLRHVVGTTISDSLKANAYANLSWNYAITRTKLDSARYYADSLKLISEKNNDEIGLAKSSFYYGVIGRFKGDYIQALDHLREYVDYYQLAGDSIKAVSGLYQIGVVQKNMGNYVESLESYYYILKIYRKTGNLKSVGFTLNSIGTLQKKLEKYPEAIKSFKESIAIHERLDNQLDLSNSLANLGNTYRELHEFENAKNFLFRALDIATKIKLPYRKASVHENLGSLYFEMEQYQKALEYQIESLESRKKLPSKRDLAISYNRVGNTYSKVNQPSLALENLVKSVEISKQIGSKPILEDTYKSLQQQYRDLGNINMAFKYQDLYIAIKDSILSSEKNKQMLALETYYQTTQKDQEIALLTKENEVQQANAKQQGDRLLAGLRALQDKHDCIGDVRGIGLFIGVDLVTDRASKTEATALATHVKNRMRDHRILLGSEGPKDNILKIRPPLTIDAEDIQMILETMDSILAEVHCG